MPSCPFYLLKKNDKIDQTQTPSLPFTTNLNISIIYVNPSATNKQLSYNRETIKTNNLYLKENVFKFYNLKEDELADISAFSAILIFGLSDSISPFLDCFIKK